MVLDFEPGRPDEVVSILCRDGIRETAIACAMLRADRGTVQGSPLRSDRVRRTRLARVHCTVTAGAGP